ncbi:MAG: hypothetical protein IJ081_05640 [Prevotella sp.]|nr:hypothetical protein [Prevotella sp.]
MITKEEIQELLHSTETYRVERTISTGDMDKFQEAICAFANDMPNSRKKGYLILGAHDNGELSGLKVTPSFDTPVRYRGRTFIRIGPRRDIANAQEERILAERCAASLPTFDTRPCREATIDDIDTDIIVKEYMPRAIAPDVLAEDRRPLKEQLAALHLYNMQADCPTFAALIMFGRNPKFFMHGAYIQYVHFRGNDNGGQILNERRFEGCLYKVLPELENFLRDGIITKRPVPISILREKDVVNYPFEHVQPWRERGASSAEGQ